MRLKEIKPNTAIHCTSRDQIHCLVDAGIVKDYYEEFDVPIWICIKGNGMCGWMPEVYNELIKGKNYYEKNGCVCVEFSDLIIQDPDLSAEEALLAYDQMCKENYCCNDCPIYGILGHECAHKMDGHIGEIMDAIKKWKADREKKDPEIEWFWKSYAVGRSDYKEADTEQEAMEWCEYYVKEHPEAKCTYKHVCRVKAVE